ncbi:MAG: hypothetical protein BGO10_04170 [Chlamydia sp. 32-24]|nr:MAG: hypothetical protein BGO10_04170 [Chlamydia sp. 32-24]
MSYSHFKDKEAIEHVVEAHASGKINAAEIHGTEAPGYLSAALDSARDSTIFVSLLTFFSYSLENFSFAPLITAGLAWIFWKGGRSTWLAWARLEKIHRVLEQEKWEIEHNRPQEKEELKVLYAAKGFEGKLLDDVVDVLMADGDRLLKVMIEEELGLRLESHEHPILQGLGAFLGATFATIFTLLGFYYFDFYGAFIFCLGIIFLSTFLTAKIENNRIIPAITWNLGIAAIVLSTIYFLTQQFFSL